MSRSSQLADPSPHSPPAASGARPTSRSSSRSATVSSSAPTGSRPRSSAGASGSPALSSLTLSGLSLTLAASTVTSRAHKLFLLAASPYPPRRTSPTHSTAHPFRPSSLTRPPALYSRTLSLSLPHRSILFSRPPETLRLELGAVGGECVRRSRASCPVGRPSRLVRGAPSAAARSLYRSLSATAGPGALAHACRHGTCAF